MFFHILTPTAPCATASATSRTLSAAQLADAKFSTEKVVANATDAQLAEWAPTIANIATHNAYHIGEIVMVRKEQGVWDASKGVK